MSITIKLMKVKKQKAIGRKMIREKKRRKEIRKV